MQKLFGTHLFDMIRSNHFQSVDGRRQMRKDRAAGAAFQSFQITRAGSETVPHKGNATEANSCRYESPRIQKAD